MNQAIIDLDNTDKLILMGLLSLHLSTNPSQIDMDILKKKIKNFGTIKTFFNLSKEGEKIFDWINSQNRNKKIEILIFISNNLDAEEN